MGFIDSYKHLEKLCGELLNDDRRLSAYIDEMINTPAGSRYVHNWDNDLKTLKHYRWIRNQIAHDPECNESNMCDPEDELWLDHFYSRIMNQTDPLAKYHQTRSKTKASPVHTHSIPSDINHDKSISKPKQHYWGIVCYVIIVLIFFIWLLNR